MIQSGPSACDPCHFDDVWARLQKDIFFLQKPHHPTLIIRHIDPLRTSQVDHDISQRHPLLRAHFRCPAIVHEEHRRTDSTDQVSEGEGFPWNDQVAKPFWKGRVGEPRDQLGELHLIVGGARVSILMLRDLEACGHDRLHIRPSRLLDHPGENSFSPRLPIQEPSDVRTLGTEMDFSDPVAFVEDDLVTTRGGDEACSRRGRRTGDQVVSDERDRRSSDAGFRAEQIGTLGRTRWDLDGSGRGVNESDRLVLLELRSRDTEVETGRQAVWGEILGTEVRDVRFDHIVFGDLDGPEGLKVLAWLSRPDGRVGRETDAT